MVVRSLPMKKEGLAHDVMYSSPTVADLVHDVTDTDHRTQNGSIQGRVSRCDFQTSICLNHKLDHKSTEKSTE